MPETVGKEYPEYTIHNNLKGRYFYSHFIVKETEANLAKVLIQYVHRPLQRQEPCSSSLSSSDSQKVLPHKVRVSPCKPGGRHLLNTCYISGRILGISDSKK